MTREERLQRLEDTVFPIQMPLEIKVAENKTTLYKRNPVLGKDEAIGTKISYSIQTLCGKCHQYQSVNPSTGEPSSNFCQFCGVKFDREETAENYKETQEDLPKTQEILANKKES